MTRNLSLYTVVVATGVASLTLPGGGSSREATIRPAANAPTAPTLEPCADTKPDQRLLCGRLSIPEDRSKQGGRRIELNVTVVPASATTRQPDPIFHLAGGPGERATRLAPIWAGLPFERDRDHVFVDQRGMRGSGSLYMAAGALVAGVSAATATGDGGKASASTRPSKQYHHRTVSRHGERRGDVILLRRQTNPLLFERHGHLQCLRAAGDRR